jgi:hypothetical protein
MWNERCFTVNGSGRQGRDRKGMSRNHGGAKGDPGGRRAVAKPN